MGEANVLTSVIAACELRYGAAKRGSRRLSRQIGGHPRCADDQAAESDVERVYASIRVMFERKGTPIGARERWEVGSRRVSS